MRITGGAFWNAMAKKRKQIAFLLSIALASGIFAAGNTGVAKADSDKIKEEIVILPTDVATGPAVSVEPSETASGGGIATETPDIPVQTESPKPAEPTISPVTGAAVTVTAVTENQTDTAFIAYGTKASVLLWAEVKEDGEEVIAQKYEFQWYQKSGKEWETIEDATEAKFQVSVSKKGTIQYYCKIYDKSAKQEWKSNNVTVTGYAKQINIVLGKKKAVADIFGNNFDSSSIKKAKVINGYNNTTVKKKSPKTYKKYRKLDYTKYLQVSGKCTVTAKQYCEKGLLKIEGKNGQFFTIRVSVDFPKPKMILKLSKNKRILTGYYKKNTVKNANYMKLQFMSVKQKKYISWAPFSNKFKSPVKKGKYVNATRLDIKRYRVCAVYKTAFGTKQSGWTMLRLN